MSGRAAARTWAARRGLIATKGLRDAPWSLADATGPRNGPRNGPRYRLTGVRQTVIRRDPRFEVTERLDAQDRVLKPPKIDARNHAGAAQRRPVGDCSDDG